MGYYDNRSWNISEDGSEDLAMSCLVNNHLVIMHTRFLLLLLFYDKFFITLEKEDGEEELHEVNVDDVR